MSNYMERARSSLIGVGIHAELESLVSNEFDGHPFADSLDLARLEDILPDYFGMSQGFRYVIAAAQKDVLFEAMSENKGLSREVELMNAVANFLMWDETGGIALNLSESKQRLPDILDLSRLHSELLRTDAEQILGHTIVPQFSPVTRRYLTELYRGLGSTDVVVRCAHMVAFELHAGAMIDALWGSIAAVSALPREQLQYFALHVGGDDPAEVYHVEVTQRLIEHVVPPSQRERFRASFLSAYALHIDWCRALVERAPSQGGQVSGEIWHRGACHCSGVSFRVLAPAVLDVVRCNCSICDMSGFLSLIVPASKFELLTGEKLLTTYQFNLHRARHTFCRTCGLKAFYHPRSHPEGVSVNVRCLDRSTVYGIDVTEFDGQNWEESIREWVAPPKNVESWASQ